MIYHHRPNTVPIFLRCLTCDGEGRKIFGTGVFAAGVRCMSCQGLGKHVRYLTRGRSLIPLIKPAPPASFVSRCLSALNN